MYRNFPEKNILELKTYIFLCIYLTKLEKENITKKKFRILPFTKEEILERIPVEIIRNVSENYLEDYPSICNFALDKPSIVISELNSFRNDRVRVNFTIFYNLFIKDYSYNSYYTVHIINDGLFYHLKKPSIFCDPLEERPIWKYLFLFYDFKTMKKHIVPPSLSPNLFDYLFKNITLYLDCDIFFLKILFALQFILKQEMYQLKYILPSEDIQLNISGKDYSKHIKKVIQIFEIPKIHQASTNPHPDMTKSKQLEDRINNLSIPTWIYFSLINLDNDRLNLAKRLYAYFSIQNTSSLNREGQESVNLLNDVLVRQMQKIEKYSLSDATNKIKVELSVKTLLYSVFTKLLYLSCEDGDSTGYYHETLLSEIKKEKLLSPTISIVSLSNSFTSKHSKATRYLGKSDLDTCAKQIKEGITKNNLPFNLEYILPLIESALSRQIKTISILINYVPVKVTKSYEFEIDLDELSKSFINLSKKNELYKIFDFLAKDEILQDDCFDSFINKFNIPDNLSRFLKINLELLDIFAACADNLFLNYYGKPEMLDLLEPYETE